MCDYRHAAHASHTSYEGGFSRAEIPSRLAFSPPVAHIHTPTQVGCELFLYSLTRLPSQFKKAVVQKPTNVFTLSGANIVVSETVLRRGQSLKMSRQLGGSL